MCSVQGEILPSEKAKVSVFDRGFLFGDGVYETGRTYDRCPLFLDEHWTRLRKSAKRLEISIPWSDAELTEGLFKLLTAFGKPDVYFRTIVTRGVIERVGLEFLDTTPSLVHIVQDLSLASLEEKRAKGISLVTSKVLRNPSEAIDPNIKTSNYLNSLLALKDASARHADDAILCDRSGNVAEGTTFSVFGVTREDRVVTPSLEVGILESITRRHVIQVSQTKYPTEEGRFSVKDFLTYREVFIASSVREIIPVREWDGVKFPVPGPVTKDLHQMLRSVIQDYVKKGVKF